MIPGIELHHESLDGRGYPHGHKAEEIPVLPRIIAVADTFDALTTNRPYQQAHDPEAALRIIHNLSGRRLDPTAVAALSAIYERGEIRIQQPNTQVASVADPAAPAWKAASAVYAENGPKGNPTPGHRTEIRSRWTEGHLYFLFICPYEQLNLKPRTAKRHLTFKRLPLIMRKMKAELEKLTLEYVDMRRIFSDLSQEWERRIKSGMHFYPPKKSEDRKGSL
jgi:hypothetical protein